MHLEFQQRLDKIDSQALPDLLPEEVDSILNRATLRFCKLRYGQNNRFQAPFEQIQKRTDDLLTLVVTDEQDPVAEDALEQGVYRIILDALPSNYMFYLRGRVEVTDPECGTEWMSLYISQQDDLEKLKVDPFNEPTFTDPLGYFEDGFLKVIPGPEVVVNKARITHLRTPVAVNITSTPKVSSDLPEHTHDEVVELAVKIAIEEIESPRSQTHPLTYQTIE